MMGLFIDANVIQVSGYYRQTSIGIERVETAAPVWNGKDVIEPPTPKGAIMMYAGDTVEMLKLRSQGLSEREIAQVFKERQGPVK